MFLLVSIYAEPGISCYVGTDTEPGLNMCPQFNNTGLVLTQCRDEVRVCAIIFEETTLMTFACGMPGRKAPAKDPSFYCTSN